jgi:uncharacterized membrane protein
VVGLIAICLGLIPLFGLGAIIGGIIAVVFGLLGFARARRGVATNKKMSLIGTIAGVLAGALGIWGNTRNILPAGTQRHYLSAGDGVRPR